LSPGGALVAGVLAVLLQAGGLVPGVSIASWAQPVAGIAIVFAAAAYGGRVVRWFGFTAALVLSIVTTLVTIAPAFLSFPATAGGDGTARALVTVVVSYTVAGSAVAAVLFGAWALGLTVHRRAVSPGIERSPLEVWLARDDVWTSASEGTDPASAAAVSAAESIVVEGQLEDRRTVFRRMTRTQLVIDAVIALIFCVLGVVASGPGNGGELAILAIFSIALVFRRLSPALALATAWLAAVVQMALQLPVVASDIAILLVLYSTAAYGGRLTRWAGLASAGVGALLAAVYLVLIGYGPVTFDVIKPSGGLTDAVTSFLAFFIASAAVLGLAWTLGFLVRTWQRAIRSRAQATRAVDEQRAAERSIVIEQERNRIARDMHDVVAHSLAVVIAQADGARYVRAADPGAVDTALSAISSTAREALADVRVLLAQLRRDEVGGPQPVLADLARLVEQMRSAGLRVSWDEEGTPVALGSGAQLAVYRIMQEALTNALRHGAPDTEVIASLNWSEAGVALIVDNATPAEASPEAPADVGHGLPGMRERALLAGGTLTIETQPGRFRVSAWIPAASIHTSAPPTDFPEGFER